jgi:hypothetical protein
LLLLAVAVVVQDLVPVVVLAGIFLLLDLMLSLELHIQLPLVQAVVAERKVGLITVLLVRILFLMLLLLLAEGMAQELVVLLTVVPAVPAVAAVGVAMEALPHPGKVLLAAAQQMVDILAVAAVQVLLAEQAVPQLLVLPVVQVVMALHG